MVHSGALRSSTRTIFSWILAAVLWVAPATRADEQPVTVAATKDAIQFRWPSRPGTIEIRELPLHTQADPARDGRTVWTGDGTAAHATIARFAGAADQLFARYQLADANHQPVGDPQFVTDFSGLPVRQQSLERPANKKGLACVVDDDDMAVLGTAWAAQNINIGELVDWANPNPDLSFEWEGRRIGLHAGAVARLDRSLKAKADRGVAVIGVLLNYVGKSTSKASPLIHPRTDPAMVPMGPAAFNTATAEGMLFYCAITHWLINRYTDPAAPHGRLTGLVIGNELQSHWMWYHLGEADENYVMDEYSAAVRAADLCARSVHRDFRVYISLEHHWAMRGHAEDAHREISGITLMRGMNERARRGGNFPWNLAFHPYPEDLFEPRFWNDLTTPIRLDAPRITFNNLEVLAWFLRQPDYLWQGQPRHIALTEQGFHCPKGADGEAIQAAAYALAWKRINAIPEIETFIYHRHVDHPQEGGLRLGLRECEGGNANAMGRKRQLWDVLQKAGTPDEDAAFAFALPIVGRTDWSSIVATQLDKAPPTEIQDPNVIFDFLVQRAQATRENTLAVELKRVKKDAGWLGNGLQQHPKPNGVSVLTWKVSLPQAAQQREVLTFTALLNHPDSNGASFCIKINGEPKWSRKLSGGAAEPGDIDLTPFAGQEITVAFEVDALGDANYDWATWVQPMIRFRK